MIYIFGDSFSKGTGIGIDDAAGESIPTIGTLQYVDYIWPTLLEKEMEEEVVNLSWGGTSNDFILEELASNMHKFKKRDTVIIGLSDTARCYYPMGDVIEGPNGPEAMSLLVVPQTMDILIDLLEQGDDLSGFSGGKLTVDEAEVLLQHYFYTYPKYIRVKQRNTYRQALSICRLLNNLDIKTLVWSNTTWSDFETINVWTKEQQKDGHWSPNGHLRFTDVLMYALKINISYLSCVKTRSLIENLPYNHEYINWNSGLI